MAEQTVKQIRLQHLHIADFHHRSTWNLPPLRDSIIANGIIEPLVVRDRKSGGYEIGAGARRFKAAEMAGLKTAPCLIVEMDDEDFIALQVDENRQREGLHAMDEALYCEEFGKRGLDHEAIAKRLGLKKRDVTARMRLLGLSAKARKAFVDGRFDAEAAAAIATTSDAARQSDILAALASGALQADEIVTYIRRTYTAQLDDVPWRQSDEALVAKAGSCAKCPKRSDVQRDLFPDGSTGLRCLDVDCYRSKMDAVWAIEIKRPAVELADQPPESLFLPPTGDGRPGVLRSSGMVDADAVCRHVPDRTWREAVFAAIPEDQESAPSVYLARDPDGRPRFLMREATVDRIVRRSDAAAEAARAAGEARPGPDPAATSPEAGEIAKRRADNKVRKAIIGRIAQAAVAADDDMWLWVAGRLVDLTTPKAAQQACALLADQIRALEGESEGGAQADGKALLHLLVQQSNRRARQVATAVLLFEEADIGEITEPLREVTASCGIDLAALEAEIRGGL